MPTLPLCNSTLKFQPEYHSEIKILEDIQNIKEKVILSLVFIHRKSKDSTEENARPNKRILY